jgi:transposase
MTSTNALLPAAGDAAARPARRTFPAEYKLRIVAGYDAAPAGGKGAILRRERLYHSPAIEWRRARDAGAVTGLTDQRLKRVLARKDAALAVLGEMHALLEMLSESAEWPTP